MRVRRRTFLLLRTGCGIFERRRCRQLRLFPRLLKARSRNFNHSTSRRHWWKARRWVLELGAAAWWLRRLRWSCLCRQLLLDCWWFATMKAGCGGCRREVLRSRRRWRLQQRRRLGHRGEETMQAVQQRKANQI